MQWILSKDLLLSPISNNQIHSCASAHELPFQNGSHVFPFNPDRKVGNHNRF